MKIEKKTVDENIMDREILDKIIALRCELHKIPERSMEEYQTKELLMDFMNRETDAQVHDCGNWFYAVFRIPCTGEENEAIAFRADMDAVCGPDDRPGHYCGHDGHSAALAGLGLVLSKWKRDEWDEQSDLRGTRSVYLIFQPAEETGQGAMLCAPLLHEKQIREIYGFHNIPGYSRGAVLLKRGTFACASTGLEIAFHGAQAHAAYPEAGRNPATALAHTICDVHDEAARKNGQKGMVLSTVIGIEAGSRAYGVSAADGVLRLTVRAEREEDFGELLDYVQETVGKHAGEEGLDSHITEIERFPATQNHDAALERVRTAAWWAGLETIELKEPFRWSEDFGYYLQETEGAFVGIGDGEEYPQLHTQEYQFPDEIIETAVTLFAAILR